MTPRTPCARCKQHVTRRGVTWPEGFVCRRCYQRATRIRGRCSGCSTERLLPGRDSLGQSICTTCAGIPQDLRCSRCGDEDEPFRRGLCARCCLKDELSELLADRTGDIHPRLKPIFDGLTTQNNPRSAIIWLRNPHVLRLLGGFADGSLPISHETFQSYPSQRTATHLRDLFAKHGILAPVDKYMVAFEQWLENKLADGPSYDPLGLLKKFSVWHHLKRLRAISENRPLPEGTMAAARQEITVAANFLEWLHIQGKAAGECQQADIDLWLSTGPTTRSLARTFVRWCISKQHIPSVNFPYRIARTTPMLSNDQRITHLRKLLESSDIDLYICVAAVLLLLYAQPVTRICSIRMDEVSISVDGLEIRFGKDWVPVPEPFAELIREYASNRPNMNTASNPHSNWLFPGYAPGKHMHAQSVMRGLRKIGINLQGARNSALRELVLEVPPAVVAEMFSYHAATAERHAQAAGATWSSYPALRDDG